MKRFFLRCRKCGQPSSFALQASCRACGFPVLDVVYDPPLADVARWRSTAEEASMWRYQDLLPLADPRRIVSLGEGGTPLIRARALGEQLGLHSLYLKDERQNPTGSFKDRQASLAFSTLAEHGVREVVVASTGNVARAYAAYGARAGIQVHVFFPSATPAERIAEAAALGALPVVIDGNYDTAKIRARQFAEQHGVQLDQGVRTVAAIEGMKTLAFEIAQQLGWRSPDWYIQAVSGGMGPVGVAKGFFELLELGLVDSMPALGLVQAAGCAPMADAFAQNLRHPLPVKDPSTRILPLQTGDPGLVYEVLYDLISAHHGAFVSVTDDEAQEAQNEVARTEGLLIGLAAAAALAGLGKLVRFGRIAADACVVVNCSSQARGAPGAEDPRSGTTRQVSADHAKEGT